MINDNIIGRTNNPTPKDVITIYELCHRMGIKFWNLMVYVDSSFPVFKWK